jgi:hypothetical protein
MNKQLSFTRLLPTTLKLASSLPNKEAQKPCEVRGGSQGSLSYMSQIIRAAHRGTPHVREHNKRYKKGLLLNI